MRNASRLLAGALVASALSSTAFAGGFQRGTADTDILYEKGGFSTRAGVTYIAPLRGFDTINGNSGDYGDYTGRYVIPSAAIYFGGDAFGCAGTATESFAAEADYTGSPGGALPSQVSSAVTTSRTRSIEFDSQEFAATCRASLNTDYGRFSLLGGVFFEDFSFEGSSFGERNLAASFAGTPVAALLAARGASIFLPTQADVDPEGDFKTGYRIGAAYELPDIALRAQVIYRSEVKHDDVTGSGTVTITDSAFVRLANGTQLSIPTVFGPAAGLVNSRLPAAGTIIPVASSINEATSPQYLTVNLQTGIAEGTLLLANFRWTDWSTNNEVISTITSPLIGTSSAIQPYYWRDGYTASLGIGRAFNEMISGAVSVGYDRGVSTGADTTYTDLYTLSGGFSLKPDKSTEFRVGGLVGYWTADDQTIDEGGYFNASVGDDVVLGASASFKFTF
ncbi:long-chain fatty acid transporter [Aurantimonas sp. Leaf443]|uniref:long-chain fatty acid transporter n=1 Tax=Aurantimonas sp. Leaf443 TaxID=1736378 RepID=UPI0006F2EC02|nr:long-chain fatty acid transporter [Aurantimonas sp. Leaf443]KQT82541.1 long-chain fatty acid transporter [Aurantimonas sp. Leaf443]